MEFSLLDGGGGAGESDFYRPGCFFLLSPSICFMQAYGKSINWTQDKLKLTHKAIDLKINKGR